MPRGFVGCPSDRWGRGGGTRTTSSDLESFAVGVVWIGGCFQGLWTFLRLVRESWMGFGGMIGAGLEISLRNLIFVLRRKTQETQETQALFDFFVIHVNIVIYNIEFYIFTF